MLSLYLQRFNNASIPTSLQATFPYIFAVSQYLQVRISHNRQDIILFHSENTIVVEKTPERSDLAWCCTAWSIWSGGLYHLWRGRKAIPECLLQWNHRGSWIWRSSQRRICFPYNTRNRSPPPPRSMGIQPSSASHQGKPLDLFFRFIICAVKHSFDKLLFYQKTKKVSKVEVGTRSTDASLDEWLEVRFSLFYSSSSSLWLNNLIDPCVIISSGDYFGQDIVWEIEEQEELKEMFCSFQLL